MVKVLKIKLNPPSQTRKRGWSEAQRKAQGDIVRARKPWLHSTGPVTETGKKRSSRNALKHGMESALTLRFKRLLRAQKKFMIRAKAYCREQRRQRRAAHHLICSLYPSMEFLKLMKEMGRFLNRRKLLPKKNKIKLLKLRLRTAIDSLSPQRNKWGRGLGRGGSKSWFLNPSTRPPPLIPPSGREIVWAFAGMTKKLRVSSL